MRQETKSSIATFFFGMFAFVLILITWELTPSQINARWRQEAVDHGAGEWVLMSEPGPETKFEFKWLKNDND
jgi:hypothetical protein